MVGAFTLTQREVNQDHTIRQPILEEIQKLRAGRLLISFFISFRSQVPLGSEDADMIEEVLNNSDTSKGVTLLLDAPGGDGLAAERIIQLCKQYSQGDFETIVATRAKSAATMVCLGSDKILMGATSELGPIDPQIPLKIGDGWQWVAACHVVKTYNDLLQSAVNLKSGNIEPYLQQLAQFNATQIQMLEAATKLSESIAIASLKRGMLKDQTEKEIKKRIECFTNPDITLSHGRALNIEHLEATGLNIEEIDLNSDLWKAIRNLYTRTSYIVNRSDTGRKVLETVASSYHAG